jgi:hypothetical protein
MLLEVLEGEFGMEEAKPLAQLFERAEGLVDVAVGHEEEPVIEREEVPEKVEVTGEPLVPS